MAATTGSESEFHNSYFSVGERRLRNNVIIYSGVRCLSPDVEFQVFRGLSQKVLLFMVDLLVHPAIGPHKLHKLNLTTREVMESLDPESDKDVEPGSYVVQWSGCKSTQMVAWETVHPSDSRPSKEDSAPSTAMDVVTDFKRRLLQRDGGCVVCHALGHKWHESGSRYGTELLRGAYVLPPEDHNLWYSEGLDKHATDPEAKDLENSRFGIKQDSLDNGLLLCPNHHKALDAGAYFIHPDDHTLIPMTSVFVEMWGKHVTKSWLNADPHYPPPGAEILRVHARKTVHKNAMVRAEFFKAVDDGSDSETDVMKVAMVEAYVRDSGRYPPPLESAGTTPSP